MLRVVGGAASDCAGITRRNFVQAGVLGLGGLALGDLFRLQAAQAAAPAKDASVILFWLSGGPGHMETWDPKPDAVAQFRDPRIAAVIQVISCPRHAPAEFPPRQIVAFDRSGVSVRHVK